MSSESAVAVIPTIDSITIPDNLKIPIYPDLQYYSSVVTLSSDLSIDPDSTVVICTSVIGEINDCATHQHQPVQLVQFSMTEDDMDVHLSIPIPENHLT